MSESLRRAFLHGFPAIDWSRIKAPARPAFFVDEAHLFAPVDYAGVEARVLSWPTPGTGKAVIPAMVRPLEPAPEPESASVVMLRALLAERRALKGRADSSRKSRIAQAEEAERRAADLRSRAGDDEAVVAQADAEIATILADIEKLGGKPETDA